jgi:hypothetical protein
MICPVNVGLALRIVKVFVKGSGSSTEKRPSACATIPKFSLVSPFSV